MPDQAAVSNLPRSMGAQEGSIYLGLIIELRYARSGLDEI